MEVGASSSAPVLPAIVPAIVPDRSNHRVVIALCHRSPRNFLTIPSCPYCHCVHKHKVPGIKLTRIKHVNGDVIPYKRSFFTKISDCQNNSYTYALELRLEEDIPLEVKKLCRGLTARGIPCKRRVREGTCVCLQHDKQLDEITSKRAEELMARLVEGH